MELIPTESTVKRYTAEQIASSLSDDIAKLSVNLPKSATKSAKLNNHTSADCSSTDDIFRNCGDGERTKQLTRIIGVLLYKGLDIEMIIPICLNWNAANNPPLPDEKVISTCNSILATHQRNQGSESTSSENTYAAPLFNIKDCSVARYLNTIPPPRKWLLDGLLTFGKTGMMVATGGTGKTQLLIQLAISVATGIKFCGMYEVGTVGKVVMLLAEEDDDEIHMRLHNTANQMIRGPDAKNLNDLLEKNLLVKSMVGENNLMTSTLKNGEVGRTNYSARLITSLDGIDDIALIIIDPAARFRGGNENSSEDGTRFVEELEFIRKSTGATVLVAHHTNKYSTSSEEPNQNASRGSSALTDGMRWQMNLATLSKNECSSYGIAEADRRNYLKAAVTKNNYGPPLEPLLLVRVDGGYLSPVPNGSPRFSKDEHDTLAILDKIKSSKSTFSATNFIKSHAGLEKPLRIADNRMRVLINKACESNKLKKDSLKLKVTSIGEQFLNESKGSFDIMIRR